MAATLCHTHRNAIRRPPMIQLATKAIAAARSVATKSKRPRCDGHGAGPAPRGTPRHTYANHRYGSTYVAPITGTNPATANVPAAIAAPIHPAARLDAVRPSLPTTVATTTTAPNAINVDCRVGVNAA